MSDQRYDAPATVAVATTAAPVVARSPRVGYVPARTNTMRDGVARILPDLDTPVSGYEGSFPGPTIRARRGRPVHVTQTNGLGEDLVVHLHGGITPPGSDGHPAQIIAPGASRVFDYPNDQPGATPRAARIRVDPSSSSASSVSSRRRCAARALRNA